MPTIYNWVIGNTPLKVNQDEETGSVNFIFNLGFEKSRIITRHPKPSGDMEFLTGLDAKIARFKDFPPDKIESEKLFAFDEDYPRYKLCYDSLGDTSTLNVEEFFIRMNQSGNEVMVEVLLGFIEHLTKEK